jgi:hypothetical protein
LAKINVADFGDHSKPHGLPYTILLANRDPVRRTEVSEELEGFAQVSSGVQSLF